MRNEVFSTKVETKDTSEMREDEGWKRLKEESEFFRSARSRTEDTQSRAQQNEQARKGRETRRETHRWERKEMTRRKRRESVAEKGFMLYRR